jgi:hypothetical protein
VQSGQYFAELTRRNLVKRRTFFPEYGGEGVNTRRKLLSQGEFDVIVCATSGISARSRRVFLARFTSAMEWSDTGKKMIVHQESCNP